MADKKIVCVIGATGNQGGSVARRFLQDPRFTVRALTRDTTSAKAQALKELGAEVVAAELDDVATLEVAFQGANIIFSVTQYWEPFFRPDCRAKAAELGISCRRYAYDVEYQQGRNIADAAATAVSTLDDNGFLVSTLSHANKSGGGAFTELYHFDAKADVFPTYAAEKYPALAAKMSCIHTGYFMTSYQILPGSYFNKQPDGSYQMRFVTAEDRPVPHLDVTSDTGNFVYAVSQMPPGKNYMAAGSTVGFGEYIKLWGKATGVPVSYKQITFEEQVADSGDDEDLGVEVTQMFAYSDSPGYDGGMDLVTAEDLRKAGIDCPMTTLEEWISKQDWSGILA
ncbi:NAD(P)-binding protein [Lasiosphaeria hispida]|uniref:NAD(P)-binding protein n=1 Tax=Lasiosphaeria hispida TaxID=260671 RepID=A0AAJ0HI53_9PEZI|nr:NAD(P)-binding protein [Lasiosphaeria hispida]